MSGLRWLSDVTGISSLWGGSAPVETADLAYARELREAKALLARLAVMPLAEPDALEDLIRSAEAKAGTDIPAARIILRDAQSTFNNLSEQAEEEQDDAFQAARYKPRYEAQRRVATKVLAQLKAPALNDTTRALQVETALTRAAAEAAKTPPEYAAAFDLLKGFGKGTIAEATAAAESALTAQCGAPFMRALAEARAALARHEPMAMPVKLKLFRKGIDDAIAQARGGAAPAARIALDGIKTQLERLTGLQTENKRLFEATLAETEAMMPRFTEDAPVATITAFRERIRKEKDRGTLHHYYSMATPKLREIGEAIAIEGHTYNRGRWEMKAPELRAAKSEAARLRTFKLAAPRAEHALAQLDTIVNGTAERDRNWVGAMAALDAVTAELAAISASLAPYISFQSTRDAAEAEVQREIVAVNTQLAALHEKMKAAQTGVGGHFGALAQQFDTIKGDWANRKAIATTAEELGKAGVIAALQALAGRIRDLPEDQVRALAGQAKGKDDQRAFASKTAEVEAVLTELSDMGETGALDAEFKRTVAGAAADYTAAVAALDRLLPRVRSRLAEVKAAHTSALATATGKIEETVDAIEELSNTAGLDQDTRNFLDALKQEAEDLKGLCETPNVEVIKETTKTLKAMLKKARRMTTTALNPGNKATFVKVRERSDKIAKRLKLPVLKSVRPAALVQLDTEFAEIQNKIKTMMPHAALTEILQPFAQSVEEAINLALTAKNLRDAIATDLAAAKAQVEALEEQAESYAGKITKRLKEIRAQAKQEGQEQQAQTALQAVRAELTATAASPEAAVARERTSQAEDFEQERLSEEYATQLEVFEEALVEARAAVTGTPDGDRHRLEEVTASGQRAKDLAGTEKYAEALRQVNAALEQAQRLKEQPQGPRAVCRNNLGSLGGAWKAAVTKFNASVGTVRTAIAGKSRDDPGVAGNPELQAALPKIAGQLEKLAALFDATVFDTPLQVLARATEPLGPRRAAREEALRSVREYLVRIEKDPMLMKMSPSNPFGDLDVRPLHKALRDLRDNVAGCV